MKVVDLTQSLHEGMDIYPGDPKFKSKKWFSVEKDGYSVHKIILGTHTGTHIDAPSHMVVNGKTLDKINPDRLIGVAVVLHFNKKIVTKNDINKYDIPTDSIVLITTQKKGYLTEGAAEYLVSKNIKLIGFHKNCIVDKEGPDGFPCHKKFLRNNIPIVTDMVNTDKVMNGDLMVMAPMNIKDVGGAPCRVFTIKR